MHADEAFGCLEVFGEGILARGGRPEDSNQLRTVAVSAKFGEASTLAQLGSPSRTWLNARLGMGRRPLARCPS